MRTSEAVTTIVSALRHGKMLGMDNFRDSSSERIGDWLRSSGDVIARRDIGAGVLVVSLFAFSIWMGSAPEVQALRPWVMAS